MGRAALLLAACLAFMGEIAPAARAEASPPPGFEAFAGPIPAGGFKAVALPGLDKTTVPLEATPGQPVLLHVFATWCEPCREELPRLAALATQSKPPTLYLVSLAEPADRVRRFMARIGVAFPVQLDADRALSRALGVSSLPTTIVLDGSLTPRFIAEGDIDWSQPEVRAWLATLGSSQPGRALASPNNPSLQPGSMTEGASNAPP